MKHKVHEWLQRSPVSIECKNCGYCVKADPEGAARNSWTHYPEDKLILVGKDSVTFGDAEKAMKIWGVECSA